MAFEITITSLYADLIPFMHGANAMLNRTIAVLYSLYT